MTGRSGDDAVAGMPACSGRAGPSPFSSMNIIHVTTRTPDQIASAFSAVFKDIAPIVPAKPVTQEDRLAPYRKEVLKQRRRGLNWKQIAAGMADPRIGEVTSAATLKRVFGTRVPARPAAPVPVGPPPHFVLDPLTNQPISRG